MNSKGASGADAEQVLEILRRHRHLYSSTPGGKKYRFCETCIAICEREGVAGLHGFLDRISRHAPSLRDKQALIGVDRRWMLKLGAGSVVSALLSGGTALLDDDTVHPAVTSTASLAFKGGVAGLVAVAGRALLDYGEFNMRFDDYLNSENFEFDMGPIFEGVRKAGAGKTWP